MHTSNQRGPRNEATGRYLGTERRAEGFELKDVNKQFLHTEPVLLKDVGLSVFPHSFTG